MKQSNEKLKQAELLAKQQQQNETLLAQALNYFTNPSVQTSELIESLMHIQFLKNNCPEGMQLHDFVMQAAKYVKFETFSFGQIIFNYGEFGDKMYIILKGQAGVYVPKSKDDIEDELNLLNSKKSKKLLFQDDALFENRNNQNYYQNGIYLYHKVFQYFSGQCFGDVALTSDKPRSASLLVISEVLHCISINRQQYKQMCEKAIQEQNKTMELYQRILHGISQFSISKFIQNLRPISFVSQSILWEKGQEPQYLLIIMRGRVELYVNLDDSQVIQNKTASRAFTIKLKRVVLSQITNGHFVGQEELLEDIPQRKYNCQCVDNTEAYIMEAETFKKIRKNFPDIMNLLKNITTQNKNYVDQRLASVVKSIQSYQDKINKEPMNRTEKRTFYECLSLQQMSQEQTKVLRSGNKKLLTLSQSIKRKVETFQQKYKDKSPKDLIITNPELQQTIQERQDRLYYINNKKQQNNRPCHQEGFSLSNEIKNFKLNFSKSSQRFQQSDQNQIDSNFVQHSSQCISEAALSPLSKTSLQFQITQFSDILKKKQHLLLKMQQTMRQSNKSYLSIRNMKSLHSQNNIGKMIKTDVSFMNEQCVNKYERSLQSLPKLLLQENEEN
ncbi:unnamed protein product (macronuclear) [Paramecium tetraurelia]|uniref:Cyclic nucleotide-binding domain-containing protein n=1 Tax=Paramecium tetraurelia TaxID=5888 RepID=A0DQ63_PARTE|nr:uncharacterized protein GSPATT00002580001 [Paramecium tetraurelia]CAK85180.1 unnamed protein product [Paramecium tetraurelia]|eukprot:XP_001452577.1 hypothetical protein (macronuclear) [Paramecium tetraurelia strain d4-2]